MRSVLSDGFGVFEPYDWIDIVGLHLLVLLCHAPTSVAERSVVIGINLQIEFVTTSVNIELSLDDGCLYVEELRWCGESLGLSANSCH